MKMHPTICANATAAAGLVTLIRISGTDAMTLCEQAGLLLGSPWQVVSGQWQIGLGPVPCTVTSMPGPRSYTGYDLIEVIIPGSAILTEACLSELFAVGMQAAEPGAFTRMAVAQNRMTLDQAEGLLALVQAPTEAAASQALARLQGSLRDELEPMRDRLIHLRAMVEAGLDFLEEEDVTTYDPEALAEELAGMRVTLATWLSAEHDMGAEPVVCLVGAANAGKSALFSALTKEQALVSPIAGTTRDYLHGMWDCGGRSVQCVDTAGWLEAVEHQLDVAALEQGNALLQSASVVIACAAPDAPLPHSYRPEPHHIIIRTKSDAGFVKGHPAQRAVLDVSSLTGDGIEQLTGLVAERLGSIGSGEPRQQRLLHKADAILVSVLQVLPTDELLADDLRNTADALGELIGATCSDDILNAIFSRFCIGK